MPNDFEWHSEATGNGAFTGEAELADEQSLGGILESTARQVLPQAAQNHR